MATTKKVPAKKKVETRGRKKAVLAKQVWFRVTEEEKRELEQEAQDQGRMFSGHLRWEFMEGRKARGKTFP